MQEHKVEQCRFSVDSEILICSQNPDIFAEATRHWAIETFLYDSVKNCVIRKLDAFEFVFASGDN